MKGAYPKQILIPFLITICSNITDLPGFHISMSQILHFVEVWKKDTHHPILRQLTIWIVIRYHHTWHLHHCPFFTDAVFQSNMTKTMLQSRVQRTMTCQALCCMLAWHLAKVFQGGIKVIQLVRHLEENISVAGWGGGWVTKFIQKWFERTEYYSWDLTTHLLIFKSTVE